MYSIFRKILTNTKVPRIIRYLMVLVAVGFIEVVGINVGIKSDMLAGNIFGFVMAVIGALLGVYWIIQITRN